MKNKAMQVRLSTEVRDFIDARKSLQLASIDADGYPYASYAPFAIGEDCLYVLLSEIAVHGVNLQKNPRASVLIVEDEDSAEELYARIRVNYAMDVQQLEHGSDDWQTALDCLVQRHGDRPGNLSKLADFKMFRLVPTHGRYVKGFGRAFHLAGKTLVGEVLTHMTDGHKPRAEAANA
ncbi:heme utilization protein HutZ [Halioglobus japonicus]|uniref:Heme utilization protein HutZ n=1 Tax=Halioglobus japonicus TaxID=930805 RepID=A0AAP8MHF3_9GAMM|nr:pyridoxamine 5'-phosphate oxidase family protein [Halioglobus japonicus]AQA19397.1 heme utilization protein HutZ [Halioglobus japonicus]PLW87547.1 heme utilization protein HutZ [Halioglobus japonicus]GHD07875.1 heme utilization protein HutZ [Halioglobus japonicus]